jgi:uncharacterized protein (UPF0305 family)
LIRLGNDELLDIIKELCELEPSCRDFLHTRLYEKADRRQILARYKKEIVDQFFPKRGEGKLNFVEIRRVVKVYAKATKDDVGVADLMLTAVEEGTKYTQAYGDIDERFYSNLESILYKLRLMVAADPERIWPGIKIRALALIEMSDGIGWGFHDTVSDEVWEMEEAADGTDAG